MSSRMNKLAHRRVASPSFRSRRRVRQAGAAAPLRRNRLPRNPRRHSQPGGEAAATAAAERRPRPRNRRRLRRRKRSARPTMRRLRRNSPRRTSADAEAGRRDEHAGHVRALQGRHELQEGRARAAHERRARQGRSRRSVLVRLRPLLRARSRDRVVAQQGQAAVRGVRARSGDVERHAAHARARVLHGRSARQARRAALD